MNTFSPSEELPLEVTELLTHIKEVVQQSFGQVCVAGELSRLTISAQGHAYFQLIDKESSLSCCVFKTSPHLLALLKEVKDGQVLQLEGTISFYHQRGQVQLVVKKIEVISKEGILRKKFLLLKEKLQQELIFDQSKKFQLPSVTYRLAIVTSPQGAALQDFLKVIKDKMPYHQVTIVPALMQGDRAAQSVKQALEIVLNLHRKTCFDVVIITRGGGSYEDLWCFNDENLVRYVAQYPICTLSAIGHEIDVTLLDDAASLRAATPTSAGHLISQGQQIFLQRFTEARQQLHRWSLLQARYLNSIQQSFTSKHLVLLMVQRFQQMQNRLQHHGVKLSLYGDVLEQWKVQTKHRLKTIQQQWSQHVAILGERLVGQMRLAEVISPQAVLKRGYSFVCRGDQVIGSAQHFRQSLSSSSEHPIMLTFSDSSINLTEEIPLNSGQGCRHDLS